jgi:hypothetical protein
MRSAEEINALLLSCRQQFPDSAWAPLGSRNPLSPVHIITITIGAQHEQHRQTCTT